MVNDEPQPASPGAIVNITQQQPEEGHSMKTINIARAAVAADILTAVAVVAALVAWL